MITYAGDDGSLQKGVAWPNPRFTVSSDGTVTDNLTGLVWLRKVDCFAEKTRWAALDAVNGLKSGQCGLDDSSVAGNWRLPNARELQSLVDFAYTLPALSNADGTGKYNGDTFTGGAMAVAYWSSTTYAGDATMAWLMIFGTGALTLDLKGNPHGVLAVRAPGA